MSLTSADVDAICALVHDLCGVYLDQTKSYLIEARLGNLLRRTGCGDYVELARRARSDSERQLTHQVVDAMTTHETLFFRDGSPFEALSHKVLPELIDSKARSLFPRRLRIWSAACSTGQEVYSIAMTLAELLPDLAEWDISILGTDVSDETVHKASRGWYAAHEIERGLPAARRERYFRREGEGWRVSDELRAVARFQRLNLLEPFAALGKFDVVFCRNVAIYFRPEARRDLFLRIAQVMPAEGYLFVGSCETLADLGPRFTPQAHCRSHVYRPNLPTISGATVAVPMAR